MSKRAGAACKLAQAAAQMARAPAASGKQVAWRLVRLLVNHALDFDLSVLPGSYTRFYAAQVNAAAWRALEAAAAGLVAALSSNPGARGGRAVLLACADGACSPPRYQTERRPSSCTAWLPL